MKVKMKHWKRILWIEMKRLRPHCIRTANRTYYNFLDNSDLIQMRCGISSYIYPLLTVDLSMLWRGHFQTASKAQSFPLLQIHQHVSLLFRVGPGYTAHIVLAESNKISFDCIDVSTAYSQLPHRWKYTSAGFKLQRLLHFEYDNDILDPVLWNANYLGPGLVLKM